MSSYNGRRILSRSRLRTGGVVSGPFVIEASETDFIDSGETTSGDGLSVGGELNLAGELNLNDQSSYGAAGQLATGLGNENVGSGIGVSVSLDI